MDIKELEKQVAELKQKLDEQVRISTNQRIDFLEKELQKMKDRYIFLLENLLERKGKEKLEVPSQVSKSEPAFQLDKFQLLVLLKDSKAISPDFAVSAKQLKQVFGLDRTIRTIRDKLTELELLNLVASVGKKPRSYFLTPKGVSIIEKQKRDLIAFR